HLARGDEVGQQRMAAADADAVAGDELAPEPDALVLAHVGDDRGEPFVVVAFDGELAFPFRRQQFLPALRQILLAYLLRVVGMDEDMLYLRRPLMVRRDGEGGMVL